MKKSHRYEKDLLPQISTRVGTGSQKHSMALVFTFSISFIQENV